MINEIWKPIKELNNLYEVSNKGRVRSVNKQIRYKGKGKPKLFKGIILSQWKKKNGYMMIRTKINQVSKSHYVHRLVAKVFIDNPEDKREVNHKDGIKHNNYVENLQWVTSSENKFHAWNNGLNRNTKKQRDIAGMHLAVSVLDKYTGVKYRSLSQASKTLGHSVDWIKNRKNRFKIAA